MPRRKEEPYIAVLKYFLRAPLADARATLKIARWLVEEQRQDEHEPQAPKRERLRVRQNAVSPEVMSKLDESLDTLKRTARRVLGPPPPELGIKMPPDDETEVTA